MVKIYKNDRKGKNLITLSKFQMWAFILSGVLVIIACGNAYSVYTEGKTAQINAEELLQKFEHIVLKSEPSEFIEASEHQTINMETINSIEVQQPTPIVTNTSETIEKTEKPQVEHTSIAKIQIEKIDLNLSVLSEWSYDLLEISVSKFIGPEPNEPGNFVIIGHNYQNGAHFGNLNLLNHGDLIDLTDVSGRKITYEVYEISTIKPDEADKLITNEYRTVTLVTCTSDGKLRLVIKSKEVKLS